MLRNIFQIKSANTLFQHTRVVINKTKSPLSSFSSTDGKLKFEESAEKPEEEHPALRKHVNPFTVRRSTHVKENLKDSQPTVHKPPNPFTAKTASPAANYVDSKPQLNDEERERRLKVLQLEVDIAHQEGRRVPPLEFLQPHHWEQVLSLPTKSARAKYYSYLWQVSVKKESRERKKVEKRESGEVQRDEIRKERAENDHIVYGLGYTAMFLRFYDSTINHWQNNRLTRAMQFAPKIVMDCSYDSHMNKREASNAGKQLMLSFAENRAHDDPFDLHFCNVNLRDNSIQTLKRFIPTMLNPEFPMNIHHKCYTQLFPKEQLVYLTPHCRNDLEAYNPDDVYIIGAMVDTINNEPLSLAKAKRLGLRMARLPLDRYLQWGTGSGKSLTLNQMVHIMLDLKQTKSWEKALSHVPRRKVLDAVTESRYERSALDRRAKKLNIRIDKVMDKNEEADSQGQWQGNSKQPQEKRRSYKENMEFKLETWGSKKKTKMQ